MLRAIWECMECGGPVDIERPGRYYVHRQGCPVWASEPLPTPARVCGSASHADTSTAPRQDDCSLTEL